MTKITLEIDKRIFSMESPYNDMTAEELIKGFCSMLQGQTFLACTIRDALVEVSADYTEEFNLCVEC